MITKKVDIDLVLLCISLFIFLSFINPLISVVYASPGDDSNDKEIGVEWVNYYYGSAPDLEYTDEDANGFLDYLISKGFYEKFRFGNSFAWEKDFEKPSVGGWDYIYADAADFVYFAGHGDDTPAFYFGVNEDGDGNYPYMLHYSEAEWGDEDLEWIFLSACECLAESSYYRWKSAFKGLHGITGFDTVSNDTPTLGELFARYLTDWNYPIGRAWKYATMYDPNQYSWVYAAIYRVVVYTRDGLLVFDYSNDYLPGYGSGIHKDPTYYQNYPNRFYILYQWNHWRCN